MPFRSPNQQPESTGRNSFLFCHTVYLSVGQLAIASDWQLTKISNFLVNFCPSLAIAVSFFVCYYAQHVSL